MSSSPVRTINFVSNWLKIFPGFDRRVADRRADRKQAIAIGLSKARRVGVDLPPPAKGKTSESTRKNAEHAHEVGQSEPISPVNLKRSKATTKALRREGTEAASHEAMSRQVRQQAKKRTAVQRSASARKAAKSRRAHAKASMRAS